MKTTSSLVVRAVVWTVFSSASIGANAAVYELDFLSLGTSQTFDAGVYGPQLVTFTDDFTFSLAGQATVSASIATLPTLAGSILAGGSFTSFNLYAGPGFSSLIATGTGTTQTMDIASIVLDPGQYYFNVAGTRLPGFAAVAYQNTISVAGVTAVPEPQNYAMFLAGLGVMGAIAARRNKSKNSA